MEDPARHVSVANIFELYGKSLVKARQVLDHLLAGAPPEPEAAIRTALQSAMMTPDDAMTADQRAWMAVLRR